jgi:hypothetical protein
MDVEMRVFLASAIVGGEVVSFTSRPLYPMQTIHVAFVVTRMEQRTGKDDVEMKIKFPGFELRALASLARR